MTRRTRNLMRKIEKRLNGYLDLETTHCGHEPDATLAFQERERFLKFLEEEIERLVHEGRLV